ncbi:hypothetical protein J7I98_25545 [Streptomyces sp. ISL-98]|uniref:hypothetical protein n=1 Tax=Streptomyces sp. ISL-98 TaxID=2819192 RepID=UPI001BEA5C1E|nr:hypothetical protein [Streptomyces sp. ISL-98]MBT2509187.1 hypothetical protein [Streptomyces sp. ISL-98]
MALTDHHDVFIGSTRDGWTFVALNRPIPNAGRILTGAGFTAREHQGRTLYLLPPETAEDAHERAGVAAYGLMAHTHDLVDLAWTTRQHAASATAQDEVTISFTDGHVTASVTTDEAEAILTQQSFTSTGTPQQHELPAGLAERDALGAVVRTEAHLFAHGLNVRIDLGIATVQDIPPARPRTGSAPVPPPMPQPKRRSR